MNLIIEAKILKTLSHQIFSSRGVGRIDCERTVDVLIEANLRGHDSHGVIRIPKWVKGLEAKAINPAPKVKVVRQTQATALLDGDAGLGPVVAIKACDLSIDKAKKHGVGVISTRKASHIGMLGYFTEHLARHNLIGICMTNSESGMAPFGSVEKVLGTNPLSIAVPSRDLPLILDMSTSVVARGKIVLALEKREKIPEGWAVNKRGQPTTDPQEALAGALLPLGGAKGSGLAIMVDILTGALAGESVGKNVRGTYDMQAKGTKGDLFMAINPSLLTDFEQFLDSVENLITQIREAKIAPGAEQILLPGELEYLTKKKRLAEGIPIDEKLFNTLTVLAGNATLSSTIKSS